MALNACTSHAAEALTSALVRRAEAAAKLDVLTGLPGRLPYQGDLAGAIRRVREGGTVVLALVDINGLRVVNNDLDHLAGDLYLKYFAALLNSAVMPHDGRAYHVSGDEYYVLFRDGRRDAAEAVLRELREAPACPPISFGTAEAPTEEDTAADLALLAEERMKEMKFAVGDERFEATRRWLESDHWAAAQSEEVA